MPNSIRLSPGGIVPKEMNARQWDSYAANAKADYIKSGQTDYDTGTGYFLGDHNGVPKLSIGNSGGNKITWDGTTLSIAGSLVLASGYFIRSGQTAYDTGTGFWLGNDAGTPKFSIGNSAGNKLTWNGSLLSVIGQIELGNVQTFTPTWNGFSVNPTQTPSYIDLGTHAIIYWSSGAEGTLSGSSWSASNIPAAIRPSINANIAGIAAHNGDWTQVRWSISTAGVAQPAIAEVSGSNIVFDSSGWAGDAAPGAGSVWFYPL